MRRLLRRIVWNLLSDDVKRIIYSVRALMAEYRKAKADDGRVSQAELERLLKGLDDLMEPIDAYLHKLGKLI